MTTQRKAYRASILHSVADPKDVGIDESYDYFEDGVLVVENGHVVDLGHADEVLARQPKTLEVKEYKDKLITSGFIDTHIHYPQTGMIASYGEQLLDWLENYTFPEEKRFKNPVYAHKVAKLFLDELASNGTTTALVFGTVHKESVNVFPCTLR